MSTSLGLGYTQELAVLLCIGLLYSVWLYCVVVDDDILCEDMIDHRSCIHNFSSYKIKAEKNSGSEGIRTQDLCDTEAVFYQLSY